MDLDKARDFVRQHHDAVLATRRVDGWPQLSPVGVGVDEGGAVVISSRETAYKVRNLRRDPHVSACVRGEGWEWIQVDGTAEIVSLPDAMAGLVALYRQVAGEHPDWDEFREAMVQQRRLVIRIHLERAGPDRQG
ncbi:MAG: PPOX class F420-dependent oxidoreductase [Acidimicrobiales bacterium]